MSNEPTAAEVANGAKILEILNGLGIACEVVRDDIFVVKDEDLGLQVVVDAEESTVCLLMDICELPEIQFSSAEADSRLELFQKLLEANNKSVHGAFCVDGNKLLLKDNLEIENLDPNELAASITSMFLVATNTLEEVESFISEPVA